MKAKVIMLLILSGLIISCKSKTEQTETNDEGLIEISKAQFGSEQMTLGDPALFPFVEKVHFTGTIIPSMDGQARISLPIPGIIERVYCKPAQMINKGSVIFEISGNWFIDLQRDFSESSAILEKVRSDYLRAKELYQENISTQKDFIAAESSYFAENAKNKALKTKLENMGLDLARIERGEFYKSYPVKSPINGFISGIDASLGQYIEPQQTIAEIVDKSSFQLKLFTSEKDIQKIKTGQTVEFYLNANKTHKYKAILNTIGKAIKPDSRSIECYATIDQSEQINLISNQFVEGDILTSADSALAVPETAIINSDNEQYVLMFEKENNSVLYFRKIAVKTDRRADNYVELTDPGSLKNILLTGTYNIIIE